MPRHPGGVSAKARVGAPVPLAPMKPVISVGRDRKRHYCESCGRKRSVCTCPAKLEAEREMAQLEARLRIT